MLLCVSLAGLVRWSDISWCVDFHGIHKVWAPLRSVHFFSASSICSTGCWYSSICPRNHRMSWSCSWTPMSYWIGTVLLISVSHLFH